MGSHLVMTFKARFSYEYSDFRGLCAFQSIYPDCTQESMLKYTEWK